MREFTNIETFEAEKNIVVLDHLNTLHPASFNQILGLQEARQLGDRFEFPSTPKHGSLRNGADIESRFLFHPCLNNLIPDSINV
jgi:hypothetical protein